MKLMTMTLMTTILYLWWWQWWLRRMDDDYIGDTDNADDDTGKAETIHW